MSDVTDVEQERDDAISALAVVIAEREKLRAAKDAAYAERNKLVAALSKCFPALLARHPDEDKDWEDDWRWIVFITLPTGQATWHIHDSELPLFAHLERSAATWDGHSTEEKYRRVEALAPFAQMETALVDLSGDVTDDEDLATWECNPGRGCWEAARRQGRREAIAEMRRVQIGFGHTPECKCAGCEVLARMEKRES
jgi:hypothetical protein